MNRRELLLSLAAAPVAPIVANASAKPRTTRGVIIVSAVSQGTDNRVHVHFSDKRAVREFFEMLANVVWPECTSIWNPPSRAGMKMYTQGYRAFVRDVSVSLETPVAWRHFFEQYGPELVCRLRASGYDVQLPERLVVTRETIETFSFQHV